MGHVFGLRVARAGDGGALQRRMDGGRSPTFHGVVDHWLIVGVVHHDKLYAGTVHDNRADSIREDLLFGCFFSWRVEKYCKRFFAAEFLVYSLVGLQRYIHNEYRLAAGFILITAHT